MKQLDVVIIGGGLSGLACAATLIEAGQNSLLLEEHDYLGGRAVRDANDKPFQPSTLRCCEYFTHLLDLCTRIGSNPDTFLKWPTHKSDTSGVKAQQAKYTIAAITHDLNSVLIGPLSRYIEKRGGEILTGVKVRGLHPIAGTKHWLIDTEWSRLTVERVVMAAGLLEAQYLLQGLPHAGFKPILKIKPVTDLDYHQLADKDRFFQFAASLEQFRPRQATPLPGLFLAGDYTRQPYMFTLEGAVLSGEQAAMALIAHPGA